MAYIFWTNNHKDGEVKSIKCINVFHVHWKDTKIGLCMWLYFQSKSVIMSACMYAASPYSCLEALRSQHFHTHFKLAARPKWIASSTEDICPAPLNSHITTIRSVVKHQLTGFVDDNLVRVTGGQKASRVAAIRAERFGKII